MAGSPLAPDSESRRSAHWHSTKQATPKREVLIHGPGRKGKWAWSGESASKFRAREKRCSTRELVMTRRAAPHLTDGNQIRIQHSRLPRGPTVVFEIRVRYEVLSTLRLLGKLVRPPVPCRHCPPRPPVRACGSNSHPAPAPTAKRTARPSEASRDSDRQYRLGPRCRPGRVPPAAATRK